MPARDQEEFEIQAQGNNSGEQAGEITHANCSPSPARKGPFTSCKHLAAFCFSLKEFVRLKQRFCYL